jgi:hypothetical protein
MIIILPRASEGPSAIEEAQRKLDGAIADPLTVVLIVYGEGAQTERALEVCAARASVKPAIRRVVWCPDPSVLSASQKRDYFRANKAAVTIGLKDSVANSLPASKAMVRHFVEQAFLKAELQGIE